MASGHGVSQAVRNHISIWVNSTVATACAEALSKGPITKSTVTSHLKDSKKWKRVARRNSPNGQGFEREFKCEGVDGVKLIVHSPEDDYSADRYVFMVGGKAIAGGKTKLVSVFESTVNSKDKTKLMEESFQAMNENELRKLTANLTMGKDSFVFLEMERG